jgi:hypothetical protein
MNIILTSAALLGLLIFGSLSTWQNYHQGKTRLEHGLVAQQEAQSFLIPLYSSLGNLNTCSHVLAPITLPSPGPSPISIPNITLQVGDQSVTVGSTLGNATITKLNATTESCGGVCGPSGLTQRMSIEWEYLHKTSNRKLFGKISNIEFQTDSSNMLTSCVMAGATTSASGTPFDCGMVNATLGPLGVCATENQVFTNLNQVPPASGTIQNKMTSVLMRDLTAPPTGGPQTCGVNSAGIGLSISASGQVQLACALATPSPSSSPSIPPSSPACLPRPPGCQSCITGTLPMGQVCYSGTWLAGSLIRLFWVGPAPGSISCCTAGVGAASCGFLTTNYFCSGTQSGGPYPCPVHRCR